jgi:hypothetical protein
MEESQGKSEINDLLTLTDDDLMAGGQPRPGRQGTSTMPPPVRVHHGEKKHAKMKGPFGFCQVGFAKLLERGYFFTCHMFLGVAKS